MEAIRHKTSKKEKYNLNGPVGRRSHENESYWLEGDDYGMKIKDYICRTDQETHPVLYSQMKKNK